MCRSARPELNGAAGFTLLEALAALAVMGAGLAAIGTLANSSLRTDLYTERHLAEIVELPSHPWFIGVQFHPELKSRPTRPHPLFKGFVGAALEYKHALSHDPSPAPVAL